MAFMREAILSVPNLFAPNWRRSPCKRTACGQGGFAWSSNPKPFDLA